ncbi:MAG: hypothetical protein IT362_05090 [Deltaproteobacteria bacterium]|nr:hypothetical protein [Deltaproteobacteria bacterium]
MVKIGTAILNRKIETLDGKKITLLDDRVYSEFILEMARILFGGRKGGLIARCPSETWKSLGRSETIKALRFFRTATVYAALTVTKYLPEVSVAMEKEDEEFYYGTLYSDLVGARSAGFLDNQNIAIDTNYFSDIVKQENFNEKDLQQTNERFSMLAKKIKRIESSPKYPDRPSLPKQGDYVFSAVLGVTVVDEIEGNNMTLVDFDSENNISKKFLMKQAKFFKVFLD